MATEPQKSKKFRDLAMGQKEEPWSEFDPVPYLSEYGPGSVDYLEFRDKRQVGPLIQPADLFRAITGKSPNGARGLENTLRDTPRPDPVWNTRIPGIPMRPEFFNPIHPTRRIVENDTGTMTDESPPQKHINLGNTMATPPEKKPAKKTATPAVQGTKGPPTPDSADPFAMMVQSLMDLFSGGTPSPGMGGGVTEAPKGFSPYTQQPTQADVPTRNPFFTAGPDESFPSFLFEGPGLSYPKGVPGPMEAEAQKARVAQAPAPQPQAPAGGPVPVPTPNPQFHDQGTDLRDFGYMLMQMLGGDQGAAQVPPRNPMFTGGV